MARRESAYRPENCRGQISLDPTSPAEDVDGADTRALDRTAAAPGTLVRQCVAFPALGGATTRRLVPAAGELTPGRSVKRDNQDCRRPYESHRRSRCIRPPSGDNPQDGSGVFLRRTSRTRHNKRRTASPLPSTPHLGSTLARLWRAAEPSSTAAYSYPRQHQPNARATPSPECPDHDNGQTHNINRRHPPQHQRPCAVTAAGRDNAETFQYFKPGFDLAAERQAREDAGVGERIEEADLYADVRTCLDQLRQLGLWVGIAGNQTARAAELLRGLDLPVDLIATSGEWGVAKPSSQFFARVAAMVPHGPGQTLYVGDHRDNDIVPARAAGFRTALIRRGPWGYLWADDPVVRRDATWVIGSLSDIPKLVVEG